MLNVTAIKRRLHAIAGYDADEKPFVYEELARDDVPALLAKVDRQRRRIAEWEMALQFYAEPTHDDGAVAREALRLAEEVPR